MAQQHFSQEKDKAETIFYRAKPMGLFGQGYWGAGGLELEQQTKSFTGSRDTSPIISGIGK